MLQQQTLVECTRCNKPGYRFLGRYDGDEYTWIRHYNESPIKIVDGKEYYRLCLGNKIYDLDDYTPLPTQDKRNLLEPLAISMDGERIGIINRICMDCHSNKTKMDNGRPHWYKFDDGYVCRSCYDKRKRNPKLSNKTNIRLCIKCDSNITYMTKDGHALWYRFDDGFICNNCYEKHKDNNSNSNKCLNQTKPVIKPVIISNRSCICCNDNRTDTTKNGYAKWYRFGGKYLCHNCWQKLTSNVSGLRTGNIGLVGIKNIRIFLNLMDRIIKER